MGVMEISASLNTLHTLTSCGLTDVNVVSCKGSDSKVICNETLQGLSFIFFGGGGELKKGEGGLLVEYTINWSTYSPQNNIKGSTSKDKQGPKLMQLVTTGYKGLFRANPS